MPIAKSIIEYDSPHIYVRSEEEESRLKKIYSLDTDQKCTQKICIDVAVPDENEIKLTFIIQNSSETQLYSYTLEVGSTNCFTGLSLPDDFILVIEASAVGDYTIDNVVIEDHCLGLDYYLADVTSAQDYYPFGSIMPGRKFSSDYRYGFNGMEQDEEIKNTDGSSLDFGARMYDPRVSRWLSVDPLAKQYVSLSPYNYVANSPIVFIDPDGKKIISSKKKYQRKTLRDIKKTLGKDIAANFEFNDNNELIYTGDRKVLASQLKSGSDEELVAKALFYVMDEKDVTNIIYKKTHSIVDNKGNLIEVDTRETGGEGTVTISDFDVNENTVVIDPSKKAPYFTERVDRKFEYYTKTPRRQDDGSVTYDEGTTYDLDHPFRTTTTTGKYKDVREVVGTTPRNVGLLHGIGHVIYQLNNQQGYVIDIDNAARAASGGKTTPRSYDKTHTTKSGSDPLSGYKIK